MKMLLLNSGSSSLKATSMDCSPGVVDKVVARAAADWAGATTRYDRWNSSDERKTETVPWRGHAAAVRRVLDDLVPANANQNLSGPDSGLAAVGHRIVHGGEFRSSVRITPEVRARIAALTNLAPLHNPPGIETLAAAEAALPDVPQVAVFDTAFHATLSAAARTYPLPEAWTTGFGIHRFGFHGLSHAWSAQRAAEMLGRQGADLRVVICHLGHGCSASAVRGGRSIDTTMGFTPLDGLMMATRSGAVDPGIVLHVQREHGLTAAQVEHALHHESGLLGVSGVSGDMRDVLAAARAGNERAQLGIDVYAHRVRQAIGALTVTLGGIDALVFTAGVGENAAEIRVASCRGLECLGVELDPAANAAATPDADVASRGSRARILVVQAREDKMMAAEVLAVIGGTNGIAATSSTLGSQGARK